MVQVCSTNFYIDFAEFLMLRPKRGRTNRLHRKAATWALLFSATGCIQRFGAYQIQLVPQNTPVTVHVVRATDWDAQPCAVGTETRNCAVLRGAKTYTLSAPGGQQAQITSGKKVFTQSCGGRVTRITRVELSLTSSGVVSVGC
jgi:hypothetical protein